MSKSVKIRWKTPGALTVSNEVEPRNRGDEDVVPLSYAKKLVTVGMAEIIKADEAVASVQIFGDGSRDVVVRKLREPEPPPPASATPSPRIRRSKKALLKDKEGAES